MKKQLPKDFAENVLDLELAIDSSDICLEKINQLLFLYSQAVEYYNGLNDEKYMRYEARIQNMFVRPEVLNLMNKASKDPEKFKKKEEEELRKKKAAVD